MPSKRRKGRSSPRIEDDDVLPSSIQATVGSSSITTAGTSIGAGGMDGSGDEMDEGGTSGTNIWTPRPISDLKISSIYNRSAPEAPAEVRRTHSPLTDVSFIFRCLSKNKYYHHIFFVYRTTFC